MDIDKIKNNLKACAKELYSEKAVHIYIAGGSAFIIQSFTDRAIRNIDVLKHNAMDIRGIDEIFTKYDINCAVSAYFDDFPVGFASRAKEVDVEFDGNVYFYTLSLEDLVISKLCTTRFGKDVSDITSPQVVEAIDWDLLEQLANSMETSMISTQAFKDFKYQYDQYVKEYKEEVFDDI